MEEVSQSLWKKQCPKCGKEQSYSCKGSLQRAISNVVWCHSCKVNSVEYRTHMKDALIKHRSNPEVKRQTSESNIKRCSNPEVRHRMREVLITRYSNPDQRKKMSDAQIKRYSNPRFAMQLSKKGIERCSNPEYRRNMRDVQIKRCSNPEVRKQFRIRALARLERLGISSCIDAGATEWITEMNGMGYNFLPTRFLDIGYDADGYDKEKHIWMEYDTPYHKTNSQHRKDLIRQQNIITHFESIGKPLNQFIRVDATMSNRMGVAVVYRSPNG